MIVHPESHVDHVPPEVVDHVLKRYADRPPGFFIDTFTLPDHLPPLESALYGPHAGDGPVHEGEVLYQPRPGRPYPSRIVVGRPKRMTRTVTVVAGPHGADPSVLYTVYGGPQAPREPADDSRPWRPGEREEAQQFWSQHALAR